MVYVGFDTAISDVHGVVLRGWPLKDFVAPGSISSRVILNTLHEAWVSGTTAFYRLSAVEFAQYSAARTKVMEAMATDDANSVESHPPNSESPSANDASPPPESSPSTVNNLSALARLPLTTFINATTVKGIDGTPIIVPGKVPQKKRSDAGKPKKNTAAAKERTSKASSQREDKRTRSKGKGKRTRRQRRESDEDSDEETDPENDPDTDDNDEPTAKRSRTSKPATSRSLRPRKVMSAATVQSDSE